MIGNISKEDLELLKALRFGPISDANIPDESVRDDLFERGLIDRTAGFQWLNTEGVMLMIYLGHLTCSTYREVSMYIKTHLKGLIEAIDDIEGSGMSDAEYIMVLTMLRIEVDQRIKMCVVNSDGGEK